MCDYAGAAGSFFAGFASLLPVREVFGSSVRVFVGQETTSDDGRESSCITCSFSVTAMSLMSTPKDYGRRSRGHLPRGKIFPDVRESTCLAKRFCAMRLDRSDVQAVSHEAVLWGGLLTGRKSGRIPLDDGV